MEVRLRVRFDFQDGSVVRLRDGRAIFADDLLVGFPIRRDLDNPKVFILARTDGIERERWAANSEAVM